MQMDVQDGLSVYCIYLKRKKTWLSSSLFPVISTPRSFSVVSLLSPDPFCSPAHTFFCFPYSPTSYLLLPFWGYIVPLTVQCKLSDTDQIDFTASHS